MRTKAFPHILTFAAFGTLSSLAEPANETPLQMDDLWGHGTTVTLALSGKLPASVDPGSVSLRCSQGSVLAVSDAKLDGVAKLITLTLSTPLKVNTAYTLAVRGLEGADGDLEGAFRTWDDDPDGIKVFIVAGQSNMVGCGKTELGHDSDGDKKEDQGGIGSLRHLAVNDDQYPEVEYRALLEDPGKPETSPWKLREDVKVWWTDGYIDKNRRVRKGGLSPSFGSNPSWFGPEYAFGQVVGDHFDEPVLVLKTAWGGIGLHDGFRSPTAVAKRGGVIGPYYKAIFRDSHKVLDHLGEEFPGWRGKGYQIVGIGWHQGYNDAVSRDHNGEYEQNLVDLIGDLRARFGKPDLPFSIATTSMWPADRPDNKVELAQRAVADSDKYPKFKGNVATTDTGPFWRDASVSPSNFAHHWNHNAESYYLVGKGIGDRMIEMLER